jgi:hypothetical protein
MRGGASTAATSLRTLTSVDLAAVAVVAQACRDGEHLEFD